MMMSGQREGKWEFPFFKSARYFGSTQFFQIKETIENKNFTNTAEKINS